MWLRFCLYILVPTSGTQNPFFFSRQGKAMHWQLHCKLSDFRSSYAICGTISPVPRHPRAFRPVSETGNGRRKRKRETRETGSRVGGSTVEDMREGVGFGCISGTDFWDPEFVIFSGQGNALARASSWLLAPVMPMVNSPSPRAQ